MKETNGKKSKMVKLLTQLRQPNLYLVSLLQVFKFFRGLTMSHPVMQTHMFQDGPENDIISLD